MVVAGESWRNLPAREQGRGEEEYLQGGVQDLPSTPAGELFIAQLCVKFISQRPIQNMISKDSQKYQVVQPLEKTGFMKPILFWHMYIPNSNSFEKREEDPDQLKEKTGIIESYK